MPWTDELPESKIFHPALPLHFQLLAGGEHKGVYDQAPGYHRLAWKVIRVNGIGWIEKKIPLKKVIILFHQTGPTL